MQGDERSGRLMVESSTILSIQPGDLILELNGFEMGLSRQVFDALVDQRQCERRITALRPFSTELCPDDNMQTNSAVDEGKHYCWSCHCWS